VLVGGTPVHTLSEGQLALWRGTTMGIIFEFPTLSEEQLIQATRGVTPRVFPAGSILIREGEPGGNLYLITCGEVEVLVRRAGGGNHQTGGHHLQGRRHARPPGSAAALEHDRRRGDRG
jgi:CRP-like cAMP-binding protein